MITVETRLKNEKFSKYIPPNKIYICIRRENLLCLLSASANQIYSVIHHFVFQFWIPNFRAENSFLPKSLPFIISKHCLPWFESNQVKTHCMCPGHFLFTNLISSQRYGKTPLDPWKSALHWSEKLATSHYAQTPNALAFSVHTKQSSSSSLSICN